jgi:hypothetical protein
LSAPGDLLAISFVSLQIFAIQDAEDMTMDWVNQKMKFFGS